MIEERTQPDPPLQRPVFRRRHRLGTEQDFDAVFGAKLRKSRGPVTVFIRPNNRSEHRLGLSVGRRMGNAVTRGRFKRMIREVFRHQRATLPRPGPLNRTDKAGQHAQQDAGPGGYDIVVTTRPHEAMTLAQYTACFLGAFEAAHRTHLKRVSR